MIFSSRSQNHDNPYPILYDFPDPINNSTEFLFIWKLPTIKNLELIAVVFFHLDVNPAKLLLLYF